MPQALKMFIDDRGQEVIQKNLYRNFVLHLINLYEFGVVGPAHVFTAVSRLQDLLRARGLQHDLAWGGQLDRLQKLQLPQEDKLNKHIKTRKNFAGIFTKSKQTV